MGRPKWQQSVWVGSSQLHIFNLIIILAVECFRMIFIKTFDRKGIHILQSWVHNILDGLEGNLKQHGDYSKTNIYSLYVSNTTPCSTFCGIKYGLNI